MTSILSTCQTPPPAGWVSIGEYEARFVAEPGNSSSLQHRPPMRGLPRNTKVYPDIMVEWVEGGGEVTQESLFIPTQEHPWKKAWNTMWSKGVTAALESIEEEPDHAGHEGLATGLALGLLHFYKTTRGFYDNLWREGKLSVREVADTFSCIHNWEQSSVRAIAFHPNLPYIAIARQDDGIEVRSLAEADHRVLLRDKKQVGITCMEWAPHYNQLLAVGSTVCVLLWHVDPTAPGSRFVTTWVRIEYCPGHAPISALSWSPYGNFLVSASPLDTNLVVWDVPMGVATKVQRSTGGGVTNVRWSPDGARVFAGCKSSLFRVWETLQWSCEKWTNSNGRCKAACWSPKGDMLLFALEGDPSLYYICFHGNELAAGSTSAIKCADLTPCTLLGDSGEQCAIGGCVQDMCWDNTGERLAVIFTRESECADLVAVLRTRASHLLDILPGGFIRGREGEFPLTVSFKPGYTDGALLAIVWTSGRVSFTPLNFQSPHSTFNFSPEQLTPLTSFQPTPSLTRHALGVATRTPHTPLYSTELDSD